MSTYAARARVRSTEERVPRWRAGVEPSGKRNFFFDQGDGRGNRRVYIGICVYRYIACIHNI